MVNVDNRLYCPLDGLSVEARENRRAQALAALGLLELGNVPVFDEATQTAAHFLDIPICVLGLMGAEHEGFKAAIGLSRLGLMNELATTRQLPRGQSFGAYVVDSCQVLAIADTLQHPAFADSVLTHRYGIRAYLGVPLLTSDGLCIGSLAVLDLVPREFTSRDVEFLQLTARWAISELERQTMAHAIAPSIPATHSTGTTPEQSGVSLAHQLRVDLLTQLTQELRTPLTSVMGMASVLMREIYGPLTGKQKEYLDIIHQSGQYLLSLVNEVLELSALKEATDELKLTSVDIEMLCQQAINTLEQACQRREQKIRLSVEPGRRIWMLDRNKVRQMIYHLLFSLLVSSTAGSILRLHVSRKVKHLSISVWVSHPWLGEGLACVNQAAQIALVPAGGLEADAHCYSESEEAHPTEFDWKAAEQNLTTPVSPQELERHSPSAAEHSALGIQLCCILAEMHGGKLVIQNTLEMGTRYVISLPQVVDAEP